MNFNDSQAEETLDTFFHCNAPPAGGDTAQLRSACSLLQQLISQDLCGNIPNTSGFEEMWIYFPVILTRIFGKQDAITKSLTAAAAATAAADDGGASAKAPGRLGVEAIVEENSWMFAATSFFSLSDKLRNHPAPAPAPGTRASSPDRVGGVDDVEGSGNAPTDGRLCCMSPTAVSLLSLLLGKPVNQSNGTSTSSANTLFKVILREKEMLFAFSCSSPPLPSHSLTFLRRNKSLNSILFLNSRLYTHCLASPPSALTMRVHSRSPGVGAGAGYADPAGGTDTSTVPTMNLTTLEYYLFNFAWYALSSSGDFYAGVGGPGRLVPGPHHDHGIETNFRADRVALAWRRYGVKGLTHRNPYMTLLKDYMETLFPLEYNSLSSGGEGSAGLGRQCELFLRVIAEFWLEGNTVLRPGVVNQEDEAASPQQQQQQQLLLQQQPAWSPRDPNGPHPSSAPAMTESYDPTEAPISSDFAAPSDVTLHGLLIVSAHLLADPKMPGACARREMSAGGTSDGAGIQAPMTPAVEVLRPHVFSFLRTVFSGNEMQPGSPGFSLAVELWMLWMRPWMAPAVLKGGSPRSFAWSSLNGSRSSGSGGGNINSSSRNSSGWSASWLNGAVQTAKFFTQVESPEAANSTNSGESTRGGRRRTGDFAGMTGRGQSGEDPWSDWVLGNYSLYTTILVAFARQASKMSFKVNDYKDTKGGNGDARGGGNGDGVGGRNAVVDPASMFRWRHVGKNNIDLLWHVTEVFSQDIVATLAAAQNTIRQARGDKDVAGAGLNEKDHRVLEEGRKALAPVQGPRLVTLEAHKGVVVELLESIGDLTYTRPPRDWSSIVARKMGFGPHPDTAQQQAQIISTKIKQLFGIPPDWRPMGHWANGGGARTTTSIADVFCPERATDAPAFLSRQGQAQIASGRKACKPWDVGYVGDPLYCPPRDWETNFFIRFWVGVSEKINARCFGWSSKMYDDADDFDETSPFFDEGPGRSIVEGKKYQRRLSAGGRWAVLPRRVNLRPLADSRAMIALATVLFLLWFFRASFTVGASFFTVFIALCLRLSFMADSLSG